MGKHKYIETPEQLWEYFEQYMEYCRSNPYLEQNWVGKDGHEVHKKISKYYSFDGFEGWMAVNGIIQDLGDYSKNDDGRYANYAPIITRIRKACKGELLTAAMSGVANGNVVSRYLGLKETTDNIHTIKDYDISMNLDG